MMDTLRTQYTALLQADRWIGRLLRVVRRFFLGVFRADYVEHSIQTTRSGECKQCGYCCQLLWSCPMQFRDEDGKSCCKLYNTVRPLNCRVYPFDATDSENPNCGYRFKK